LGKKESLVRRRWTIVILAKWSAVPVCLKMLASRGYVPPAYGRPSGKVVILDEEGLRLRRVERPHRKTNGARGQRKPRARSSFPHRSTSRRGGGKGKKWGGQSSERSHFLELPAAPQARSLSFQFGILTPRVESKEIRDPCRNGTNLFNERRMHNFKRVAGKRGGSHGCANCESKLEGGEGGKNDRRVP